MSKRKTKAQKIMALYDGVRTTSEIAAIVGCDQAYVRVVARQRKGLGTSEIDRRYLKSPLGRETLSKRYLCDKPRIYAAARAAEIVAIKTGNRFKASEAARLAFRAARKAGATSREAERARARAYRRVLRETGNKRAARAAARRAYRDTPRAAEAVEGTCSG